MLWVGLAFFVPGIALGSYFLFLLFSRGGTEAGEFLTKEVDVPEMEDTGTQRNKSRSSKTKQVEKTPPLSDPLKNKLITERANGQCEWYNCEVDTPLEVHHIIPREEGGPNKPNNLLVLCRNHHGLMDAIGKSKQEAVARRKNEKWREREGEIEWE